MWSDLHFKVCQYLLWQNDQDFADDRCQWEGWKGEQVCTALYLLLENLVRWMNHYSGLNGGKQEGSCLGHAVQKLTTPHTASILLPDHPHQKFVLKGFSKANSKVLFFPSKRRDRYIKKILKQNGIYRLFFNCGGHFLSHEYLNEPCY